MTIGAKKNVTKIFHGQTHTQAYKGINIGAGCTYMRYIY
jgi:hypothetical protein